MSENSKSATGLIVQEVAAVVPQSDKEAAGRDLGKAFKNVGSIARDLTDLLAGVAAVPRRTGEFMMRALAKFRQIPDERRRTPPPKLLLEAAQGYAGTDDDDLRACFEKLVESSMDTDTASLVHPTFLTSLNQMSGLDARFMRLLRAGAKFTSFESFYRALGDPPEASVIVTLEVMKRLGYLERIGPASAPSFEPENVPGPGQIFVYREEDEPSQREHRIYRSIFLATPVGGSFLLAIGA